MTLRNSGSSFYSTQGASAECRCKLQINVALEINEVAGYLSTPLTQITFTDGKKKHFGSN